MNQPLSISKMSADDLSEYIGKVRKFAEGDDGLVAIRICECCILIAAD